MNVRYSDSWIDAYQELLKLEKQRIDNIGLREPADKRSFLSDQDVESVCQKYGIGDVGRDKFLSDLMVNYPGLGWRTIHFDLIYRLVNIRNLERQRPIPFEYSIKIKEEPVPDFTSHKLSKVLPELVPNESVQNAILSALASKYEGLSSYQLPIVSELLSKRSKYTTAAIAAPTASGKTLTFFLPIIVRAVERSIEGRTGVSSILVYPRKALERDQLQFFLTIIDSINAQGYKITIGIDDGDTKWLADIQDGEAYRGIKCIKCSDTLHIYKEGSKTKVKCKCSKEYPYLLASKDEIWKNKPTILITNIYTIYRRLLIPETVKMFAGVDYIIFDEAHVYTDYLGGHAFYIIKLLRHAVCSNGSTPYFIFSSATIPNPKDFIANLAGIETNKIFYVDYREKLESVPNIKHRLMLYLYLLPRPDSSVETLTEALILAITLWCHRHNLKAITFVDSVSEISTLSDYIHTTILTRRQGREVTDHLSESNAPEKSYNWFTLAPRAIDPNMFNNFVLNQYSKSIDMHYSQLSLSQRAEVEYKFSQGDIKLLLSTSTLELGIDLSDVAVIIQHKLPITPEGVIQRVGRAGRSKTSLRVAMGVIVLQQSPLSTLYMFDEELQGRLEDPNLLPLARVGKTSANIRLQHILSLLLYKRALEGKPTFIAGEEYLRTKQKVVDVIKEIINELNDELLDFNTKVGLFDESEATSLINELKSMFSAVVGTIRDGDSDFIQMKKRWEEILNNVEDKANIIKQTLQQIERLEDYVKKIGLNLNFLSKLKWCIDLAYKLCIRLYRTAKSSYNAGDLGSFQRWYKTNSRDIEMVAKNIPDSNKFLELVNTPFMQWFYTNMNGNYKAFEAKYGFKYIDVSKPINDIATSLGDEGLTNFLRKLPDEAKFLNSVNLQGLITYESLSRIENELKDKREGIDIIAAINLMLLNKIRFSLMLEPPSPELQLVGVEEA